MKYYNHIFVLIILQMGCLVDRSSAVVGLNEVLDIIKLAKDVVVAIAKAWNIVDQQIDFSEIPIPILDKTEAKLFGKIGVISAKLDKIGVEVDAVGTTTIAMVLQTLPDRVRLELRLNDLLDYMTRMDVNYRHFQNYVKEQSELEQLTLEDFAKHVVSHDSSSITSLVERIHAFIAPTGRGITNTGLIKLLLKALEKSKGG
ncbi:hypothetical protein NQ315_016643 [Exocentrus adspersus]|uniref:Uncharacterized protein n=1 Tax=Exocentrus adspersus TaxID=1586481 RepID=A0AAV8VPT3_9CUCU|nr:hypothetical protein NQ315_016643 [Exocentrus adspersus]